MLLCVLAEAYAALNLHTMHRAHLLSIASFSELYSFVASLTSTPQKETLTSDRLSAYISFLHWLHLDNFETSRLRLKIISINWKSG
jgi:hypothetical protein